MLMLMTSSKSFVSLVRNAGSISMFSITFKFKRNIAHETTAQYVVSKL